MNPAASGAIGPWTGAIVVVLTRFYPAWQARLQNAIARHTALKDVLEGTNGPNQLLAENAEFRELFDRGIRSPGSLSDRQAFQISFLFRLSFNHMFRFQKAQAAGVRQD